MGGQRWVARVLAPVLVAALLGGCGARGGPAPAASGEGGAAAQDLVFLEGQVITTADPELHVDESSLIAVINLYDPLLYPRVDKGSMAPGPHVAESWTVSPDGRTYTFRIRQGIRFHDGNELTAEDVAFSMQRMLALQKGFSWLWSQVLSPDGVRVVDPYTVEFRLNFPYAPFLATLEQLFIVNKKLLTANVQPGDFGEFGDYGQKYLESHDAGSGPYRMVSYQRDAELVLEAFDDYWASLPDERPRRVVYKVVREEATQKTMLKAGQADVIDQWRSVETYRELAQTPGIVVREDPSAQLFHIILNTRKPPLDDVKVRAAVVHAFDYETAAQQIFDGAPVARGPVPIQAPWHNEAIRPMRRDLEAARRHLAQSRYAGQRLKLEYVYVNTLESERKVGLLLQQNLGELGIEVELKGVPWAQITEIAAKPETTPHMSAIFDTLKYPHPDSHTYGMYHPSAHGSYRSMSWLDDPELTRLLEAARAAVDPAEQERLYKEAQARIVALYPSVYVVNPVHRIAMRDRVEGYVYVGLLGYDLNFGRLRLKH